MNTKNSRAGCPHPAATRIVSLILSFAMLFTLIAGLNFSAFADTSGDFEYTILDDGSVEVTKYTGSDKNIIIPINFNGHKVKNIGGFSFAYCNYIESVKIPYGIEKIGKYAFAHCDNLETVYISSTVNEILDYFDNDPLFERQTPFYCSYSIKNFFVDSDNKWYSSEDGVLFNYNKTKLIQYPSGNGREEYHVPDGVKEIESQTMVRTQLESIVLPRSVEYIHGESISSLKEPLNITILNPNCIIAGMEGGDTNKAFYGKNHIIFGFKNSTAEMYARNRNCDFVELTVSSVKEKFNDLIGYDYYDEFVAYTSVYNEFLKGTNPPYNTVFEPARAIDRAMMVTILYRMAGEPYANGGNPYTSSPFTDITNTSVYYYDAACWALKNGITTETTFKPFNNVTREQTATFLYRYAQDNDTLGSVEYKNVNLNAYHDGNSISHFAVDAMKWANYNGMITGTQQGYANPQGATQRIHATKILYGFGKTCNIGNFA